MGLNREFWSGRRVLLTGHTGFKGSWLTLWLLELGADLYGLALEPDAMVGACQPLFNALNLAPRLSAAHLVGDIRDPAILANAVSFSQPDVVIHLAAQPIVRTGYIDPLTTWSTNLNGSLHVLQALKSLNKPCAVVMVTTDKVYLNQEWDYGYRESDQLGGRDPYSASKAAAELAISSWRSSFCGSAAHQTPYLSIATARAGNVIGGGDWATDRIIPDSMRSLAARQPIAIRNLTATRPWQHVLEPLAGYLLLAEKLSERNNDNYASAFNFGPNFEANRSVLALVEAILQHWPGSWINQSDTEAPHEASRLHLQIDKAQQWLSWHPHWDFSTTVARTVGWYRSVHEGASPLSCCLDDLSAYQD